MSLSDDVKTLSVPIRIRRTTTEYGYVSVEVTPEIIGEDGKLDTEKLFERAVEFSKEPQMIWYKEELIVEPHPIQQQREPHEKSLFKGQNGFELA